MNDLTLLFILLGVFQLKHFIADFPLQGHYMLGKMELNNWVLPLFAHVSVHGAFTLAIMLFVAPSLWYLAIVDMIVHFIVDRIKASPNMLNRWTTNEPYFWWSLGLDQMMHHLTHYVFIYMIIKI